MKSKNVVGKKIVGIRQRQYVDPSHGRIVDIDAIILEDGTELRPLASEIEDGDHYPVDMIVVKPSRAKP